MEMGKGMVTGMGMGMGMAILVIARPSSKVTLGCHPNSCKTL